MCKVYEFPAKSCLPKEIEKRLEKLAKDYVSELIEILDYLDDPYSDESEVDQNMAAVLEVFTTELSKAIDEL